MRLDSLDKAPVVKPDGHDVEKALPQSLEAKGVTPSSEAQSQGSQDQGKPRLAKIIDLIEEAQKRRNQGPSVPAQKITKAQVTQAYTRVYYGFTDETLGEALDRKV